MAGPADRGFTFPAQQRRGEGSRSQGQGGRTEEHASGMAGAVKEQAGEWASAVATRAGDAWEATTQEARQLASSAASGAEEAWDSFTSFIRRHPVACVMFALGVGFVMAEATQCMTSMDRR